MELKRKRRSGAPEEQPTQPPVPGVRLTKSTKELIREERRRRRYATVMVLIMIAMGIALLIWIIGRVFQPVR